MKTTSTKCKGVRCVMSIHGLAHDKGLTFSKGRTVSYFIDNIVAFLNN